jgi:RING finger protein 113A
MSEEAAPVATDTSADVPQFSFKKRSAKAKSSLRKKAASPPPPSDSDSDFTSSDDEEGRRIKRRRKNATVTASSVSNAAHKKEADTATGTTAAPLVATNDATKQSNWYDEGKEDDLSAKNLLGTTRARPGPGTKADPADGTYKGASSYSNFIQKNPNAPTKQVGPMKAPTNIRTITVLDYAPDVCKVSKILKILLIRHH